jgi:hypothetical protein
MSLVAVPKYLPWEIRPGMCGQHTAPRVRCPGKVTVCVIINVNGYGKATWILCARCGVPWRDAGPGLIR